MLVLQPYFWPSRQSRDWFQNRVRCAAVWVLILAYVDGRRSVVVCLVIVSASTPHPHPHPSIRLHSTQQVQDHHHYGANLPEAGHQ